MRLKKLLKLGVFQRACLLWFSNLAVAIAFLVGTPVVGQEFVFEQMEAPFYVLDQQGEPLLLPFLGGFNVPRPQLVDIDADGDQDLFVQEISNQLIFFEHTPGSAQFPFSKRSDTYQDLAIGEWYRFVDLDQDGDLDLLAEEPFSYIRVYENTGTPSSPAFSVAQDSLRDETGSPIFADRQNILTVVDIDADGLLDLFIGRLDGTVFHYEQQTRGAAIQELSFSLQSEQFQNISVVGGEAGKNGRHGASTLLFHDIDLDGDQDLFWGDFFESGLLIFENTGTPQIPLFPTEVVQFPENDPFTTSGYNAPAFGDVNGDGLEDMLIGVLGGAFSAFGAATDNLLLFHQEQEGEFSFVRSRFLSNIDVGSDSYPVLFDVDGDGDNDLLVGNSIDPEDTNTGSLRLFENTGDDVGAVFRDRGNLPVEPFFGITPALGDLNGDGAVDMITGSFQGEMTLYWNANEGSFTFSEAVPSFLDIPTGASSTPFLADMDADQDLDLIVGHSSGVINYFENIGNAEEPQFSLVTSSYGDIDAGRRSVPLAIDMDGDGDLDLIVGSDQDGIQTYENIGSPQDAEFARVDWLGLKVLRRMVPAWGDLNGDEEPELLVGLLDGGIRYFENQSAPVASDSEPDEVSVGFGLYPNPVSEYVQLNVTGVRNQYVTIDVFNMLGQRVRSVYQGVIYDEIFSTRVDVSGLAVGSYLALVRIEGTSYRKMVVKV